MVRPLKARNKRYGGAGRHGSSSCAAPELRTVGPDHAKARIRDDLLRPGRGPVPKPAGRAPKLLFIFNL